ncbi:MAG: formylglycine-generating enzyme family protein [Jatrophihabitantaceae bacterium]
MLIDFSPRLLSVGSADGTAREQPVHEVEIDAYALADRCVSAADFYAFIRDAPAQIDHSLIDCIDPCFVVHRAGGFELRPGCADFPMIQLSFWAAAGYCNWLSRAEGLRSVYDVGARTADLDNDGYRLPTEAEWEAACQAGQPAVELANTADADHACRAVQAGESAAGNFRPGEPGPVRVAALPADAAGLYGMLGNVREWCHDRFGPYRSGRQRNPTGADRGAFRVVRGGSFIDPASTVGPTSRLAAHEDTKCEVYGFRVGRSR